MKYLALLGCVLFASPAFAQETSSQPDYSGLSNLIRGIVLKSAPKEFVEDSAWGLSRPFPERLRLPGLPRTTIKVGDQVQLAHGNWRKAKVSMENAERDFALAITDIKPLEDSKYKVSLTGSAPLLIDYEMEQWVNGLMVFGIGGRAKAKVRADIVCEVKLTLNGLMLPPDVTIDPKLTSTKVEIESFEVVNSPQINQQIRDALQNIVRGAEPQIQDEANKAIAKALRDGKGTFSAAKLFETIKK